MDRTEGNADDYSERPGSGSPPGLKSSSRCKSGERIRFHKWQGDLNVWLVRSGMRAEELYSFVDLVEEPWHRSHWLAQWPEEVVPVDKDHSLWSGRHDDLIP